jgi:hypothetical protein
MFWLENYFGRIYDKKMVVAKKIAKGCFEQVVKSKRYLEALGIG